METPSLRLAAARSCLLAALSLVAGCGSPDPKEASKENFARVIAGHLNEKKTGACIGLADYPKVVAKGSGNDLPAGFNVRERYDALEQAGILESSDTTKFGRPAKKYTLTARAEGQIRKRRRGYRYYSLLCYGTPEVEEVTGFTAPSAVPGVGKISRVNYTYTVEGITDWARHEAVQKAYGEVARWAGGDAAPKKSQTELILSGSGWMHKNEFSR